MNKYRSIFISDLHLGTKGCQADVLNDFLKNHSCETLYLVGDILDFWKLKSGKWHWPQSHTNVIRKILGKAKNGTEVIYILGNHDETFRIWASDYDLKFGNVKILNEIVHIGVDGKKYYVTHGDVFDGITRMNRWIYLLGDKSYDFALWFNKWFNKIRTRLGFPYWSLSKWLKHNVKKALTFLVEYEKSIVKYCKKKGYDGIISGHIHTPQIKTIDGIIYMNDGDFVENCSALVETMEGEFKIIYWGTDENPARH